MVTEDKHGHLSAAATLSEHRELWTPVTVSFTTLRHLGFYEPQLGGNQERFQDDMKKKREGGGVLHICYAEFYPVTPVTDITFYADDF